MYLKTFVFLYLTHVYIKSNLLITYQYYAILGGNISGNFPLNASQISQHCEYFALYIDCLLCQSCVLSILLNVENVDDTLKKVKYVLSLHVFISY